MRRFQQARKALGSEAVLTIITSDQLAADEIFTELWKRIDDFEARFSRFKPDSELSQLNQPAGKPFSASPQMIQLLRHCKTFALLTAGTFNPFTLPALQKAGYKGSWPSPDKFDPNLDVSERHVVATQELVIRNNLVTIPARSALDLGGIGKGYLLDELADWLINRGLTDFWMSLGGDIVCSGYDCGKSGLTNQWSIVISDTTGDKPVAVVKNLRGERLAIATSGITKRRGADWHHLIDPRTDRPAKTNLLHVSVICTSATAADVYAKSLLINPDTQLPVSGKHALLGQVRQDAKLNVTILNGGGRFESYHYSYAH